MSILYVVLLFAGVGVVESIRSYDMQSNCGGVLSFVWQDLYQTVVYYEHNPSAIVQDCLYSVEAYSEDRLMFYFDELDISCSLGTLTVTDGDIGAPKTDLVNDTCGQKLEDVYTSVSRTINIEFKPQIAGSQDDRAYFKIVITSFHTGMCKSYEYNCDNGRCIHDDIACKGHNPCGDNSDCREDGSDKLDGIVIAAIVIGSILVVGGIIFVAVLVYKCTRKRTTANPWSAAPAGQQQTPVAIAYPQGPYTQVHIPNQQQYQSPQTFGQNHQL